MNLFDLFTWILVAFGMTISVTHGKIFNSFRNWTAKKSTFLGDLFRCPMCLGFWVGIFLGVAWESVTGCPVLDGFLSLATCFGLYSILWSIALKDV